MSAQRRVFGDVKNTISGTPAALRDQKSRLFNGNKGFATPATSKSPSSSLHKLHDPFITPSTTRTARTPFSIYAGTRRTITSDVDVRRESASFDQYEKQEAVEKCTYTTPKEDRYEDLREARESQPMYTLHEDDELSFNQQESYGKFTAPDFDEENFFAELLAGK